MLHNSTTKAEFLKILVTVLFGFFSEYMQSGDLYCDFYKLVELRGQWIFRVKSIVIQQWASVAACKILQVSRCVKSSLSVMRMIYRVSNQTFPSHSSCVSLIQGFILRLHHSWLYMVMSRAGLPYAT